MVKSHLKLFGRVEKAYRSPSKESGSDGGQSIVRRKGRPRKTIGETIIRDLDFNGL